MNNGLVATIIDYRANSDIDVMFDICEIAFNKTYISFKRGSIKCPLIICYENDYARVTNPNSPDNFSWIMDIEDLPLLEGYLWSDSGKGYPARALHPGHLKLHHLIMNAPDGMILDHKNGDRADCRKSNLRVATPHDNARNRGLNKNSKSGYKGVYMRSDSATWRASIRHNGKTINLGSYDDVITAAVAYNNAAIKYHGEFAKLNDIPNEYKR
jgi:hypothetical protein